MTHDELLAKIMRTEFYKEKQPNNVSISVGAYNNENANAKALRAVVELHKPFLSNKFYAETLNAEPDIICQDCTAFQHTVKYPCRTIQAILKELN